MSVATDVKPPQSSHTATARMKALVYHGPGKKAWEEVPRPAIKESTDAIVRITTSTICGTDLHILKGDLPGVAEGRILGHEGIGIVHETGTAVTSVRTGDRVLISCVTACGKCDYCRRGMSRIAASAAGSSATPSTARRRRDARIPHADTSLHPVPTGADEEAWVMLSDILPTGFGMRRPRGQVKPGDNVAIVGAGPIGSRRAPRRSSIRRAQSS